VNDNFYHEKLVAMARAAIGSGEVPPPALAGEADNPLCGDRVRITLTLDNGRIAALAHRTRGCLLCEAAASAIGRRAPGSSPDELRNLEAAFRNWLKSGADLTESIWPELADFAPVRGARSRHDCVLLPFDALLRALKPD
jgi:nitrogen fixation protein NifU and related proteins